MKRAAKAATRNAPGSARPCSHWPLPPGTAIRTPAPAAIETSTAKSRRRATAVVAAASAPGTPRRIAISGRAASPMPNGSTWLASSVVCRTANREKVPARCVNNTRHAMALNQNAAENAATNAASSSGWVPSPVIADQSCARSTTRPTKIMTQTESRSPRLILTGNLICQARVPALTLCLVFWYGDINGLCAVPLTSCERLPYVHNCVCPYYLANVARQSGTRLIGMSSPVRTSLGNFSASTRSRGSD